MNTELLKFPQTFLNRTLLKADLDRYIKADSLQQLILALRKYHREGILDFEVRLDPSYVEQQDALSTLKTRTDVLKPALGIWAYRNNADGLGRYYADIERKKPLTESQSAEIIEKLSTELALQYFQFRITHVDWDRFNSYIAKYPKKSSSTRTLSYDLVKYKDLRIENLSVTYRNQNIPMSDQHQQVLRLLMEHKGNICTQEDFFDGYANVFSRDIPRPEVTLRKLISAVRKELELYVGYNCIINKPSVGWYLELN